MEEEIKEEIKEVRWVSRRFSETIGSVKPVTVPVRMTKDRFDASLSKRLSRHLDKLIERNKHK